MSELLKPRDGSPANVFDAARSTINSERMSLIIAFPPILNGVIARDNLARTNRRQAKTHGGRPAGASKKVPPSALRLPPGDDLGAFLDGVGDVRLDLFDRLRFDEWPDHCARIEQKLAKLAGDAHVNP